MEVGGREGRMTGKRTGRIGGGEETRRWNERLKDKRHEGGEFGET